MHLDQTKDIDVWKRNKYGIINFTTVVIRLTKMALILNNGHRYVSII